MDHLAVISILIAAAHIVCFAAMTERKYTVGKTVLLYGLYAVFFTVWAVLAFVMLGSDLPYVIPFSFVGIILPAFLLFLYTSSDTFSKKLFLMITYSNFFCIFFCISVLICDGLFPDLSDIGQMYARNIVRTLLYVPAILMYLRFARPHMRRAPGDKKRTWYSVSLVSALFLIVFSIFAFFAMRADRVAKYILLFVMAMMIYYAVLWVVFGTIRYLNGEVKLELISKNVQYLQRQLVIARENALTAKAVRHDFRHHMQNINLLLKREKTQDAMHYIEEFINSLDAGSQIDFCPHVTVNAILANFYNKAKKEGIFISVTADTPENTAVADMDFVAILSNLLENEINGCAECGAHGEIKVNIRTNKGKLVIVCSNPCKPDLVIEDDIIKPKGTGIESILMAVDKYDGNIRYRLERGIVTVSIVLTC